MEHLTRAAILSQSSCGETQPHPNAACILTNTTGDIIAEAYLSAQGTEPPEVRAVRCANGAAVGGTAYLNLETGDCHGDASGVRALLSAGVARVVIGLRHPNAALRGNTINALHAAGIPVLILSESPSTASLDAVNAADLAVLAANDALLHVSALGRPLGVLKYAMTLDGKIAATSGHSAWVSGTDSRQQVFATRARSDAVIVGGQTVRRDNPRLTTRREGGHQPIRVVMSRTLDLPVDANLWDTSHAPTIVATQRGARKEFQKKLRARGVEVLEFEFLTPAAVADYCRQRGFLSLLWECGGKLAAPAIAGGAVHKVMAFVAPKIIGGTKAPTPVGDLGFVEMTQALAIHDATWTQHGPDLMLTGYLPVSGGPRALAAALGLRPQLPELIGVPTHGSTGGGGSSGASGRSHSTRNSSNAAVAGFYKSWDRFGSFSNFTAHAICMPEGAMTAARMQSFHPPLQQLQQKNNIDCSHDNNDDVDGVAETSSWRTWKSSEHYYQAQKFEGVDHPEAAALREQIFAAESPEAAAKLGRRHERTRPDLLREDWGESKVAVMHAALRAKFAAHDGPRKMLLETAQSGALIEETAPHDYFWARGIDGSGENMLGKLLMQVRGELLESDEDEQRRRQQGNGNASREETSGAGAM